MTYGVVSTWRDQVMFETPTITRVEAEGSSVAHSWPELTCWRFFIQWRNPVTTLLADISQMALWWFLANRTTSWLAIQREQHPHISCNWSGVAPRASTGEAQTADATEESKVQNHWFHRCQRLLNSQFQFRFIPRIWGKDYPVESFSWEFSCM